MPYGSGGTVDLSSGKIVKTFNGMSSFEFEQIYSYNHYVCMISCQLCKTSRRIKQCDASLLLRQINGKTNLHNELEMSSSIKF